MKTDTPEKSALITGAGRGIGRATALTLARDGYEVWLNYYQDHQAAEATAAQIREEGGSAHTLSFDVGSVRDVREHLEPVLREKPFNVLVANAGILCTGSVLKADPDHIRRMMAVNLESFFFLVKTVARGMLRQRQGSIVAISSVAGLHGLPGQAAYSASKAGLIAAVQSVSVELAAYGIRVNAVAPGLIATEMSSALQKDTLSLIPLGRIGTAQEVADVVSFLCCPKASYITGAVIPVTGGLAS